MSIYYQNLDAPYFDYDMQPVAGIENHRFRSPPADLSRPYFACFGGAQTMGRFVHRPFSKSLSDHLGLPCLDLSLGGAGPRFALKPEILRHLQKAKFVVIQIPSGRSASCSLFDNSRSGRNDGICTRTGRHMQSDELVRDLVQSGDRVLLERYVTETRADYTQSMLQLGAALGVPTILLWFSMRDFDYPINWQQAPGIGGAYPQLVVGEMVEQFRVAFGPLVIATSTAGVPQKLWRGDAVDGTRRDADGQLWNHYYPTPEMHELATAQLLPACRALWKGSDPSSR